MTKRIRYLLVALIVSLPFWWGMNNLERNLNNIFFWQEISKNSRVFTAEIALQEKLNNLKPIRDKEIGDLEVGAKSAISVLIDKEGKGKILFEKNSNIQLPIASLTKLMTTLVVLENYDLSKEIKITKEAIAQPEDFGKLEAERNYTVEYLLYPMLMESSNDAAFALVNDYEGMNREKFVELMNSTAQKMNLQNTRFFNPTGLEPDQDKYTKELNYSTAADLALFTQELLKKPLIWKILSTATYSVYGPELRNTNELLFDDSNGWKTEIIGGKTGYTEKAGGCIILVLEAPKHYGKLVDVILGTAENGQRFEQMKKMVDWVQTAYNW